MPKSHAERSDERRSIRTSRRALIGAGGAGLLAATLVPSRQVVGQASPAAATAPVEIYPPHDTVTASPGTELSFRGVASAALGHLEVVGAESGAHAGVFHDHADGQGTSFVPDAPFLPGEWVSVRAAGTQLRPVPRGTVTFRVSVPAPPVETPVVQESDHPAVPPQSFRSRPDLSPPAMSVTNRSNQVAPGLIFLGGKIEDGINGAMILDNFAEVVWFSPVDQSVAVHNDVRVQEYDGQPVLTMWEGIAKQGTGFGHLVLHNARYERIATIQVGNGYPGIDQHECLLTDRGTVIFIVYNPIHWDLSGSGGDVDDPVLDGVIQEVEIATGRVVFEWHTLDHIGLDEAGGNVPEDLAEPWDYVHINSVEDTGDGHLIVSARHTHAVYCIKRATGRIRWRLNGTKSDFRMAEGTEFAYQHDARLHANGELSLFDNASANQKDDDTVDSRGIVLKLDEGNQVASLVREFVHPTGVLSVSQGNMQVLPNGNVFVGWGSAPVFTEWSADGRLQFNGRFEAKGSSYRAYRCPWVGSPASPPDVVFERGLGDQVMAYASWNGATEVAFWEVVAGPTADALEAVAKVPRSGFETAIRARTGEAVIAVRAIDADGAVLGTSVPFGLPGE